LPVKAKNPLEKPGDAIGPRLPRSTAFLLAQVGAHAAAQFAERLSELELLPPHAGVLRAIAGGPGGSQQRLASQLGMLPSRLVPLLDELEARALVERRNHPEDRRLYALHLTEQGEKTMSQIGRLARAHDDAVCASLSASEREQLAALLVRVANEQQLTAGVHPGFARIGEEKPGKLAPQLGSARAPNLRKKRSKR
jgi:DNA-binding MarR family transcriptional regulator